MSGFTSINPYTGATVGQYPAFAMDTLDATLETMQQAQRAWLNTPCSERASCLQKIAQALKLNCEKLATLATQEMGKPITAARDEVMKCASACEYYASNGPGFLADRHVATGRSRSYVTSRPLGIVLAIMPWNFPYWQAFRFLAPTLLAGNAAVLKHASNVSGCALAMQDIVEQAGVPASVFRALLISSDTMAEVIRHPRTSAISFTGSTDAGRLIAAEAGRYLKKTVLELGGSDPYVVLEDASLEQAVDICVKSRLVNNGQSCIAAKRFIVHAALYDSFIDSMAEKMKMVRTGDPMQETTQVGPLARPDLAQNLQQQVDASIAAGARLVLGGTLEQTVYPPSILADVKPGMAAFDEELFGPVAAVIRAESEEHAVTLANATSFGLGAAVFTRDNKRGERLAREALNAGSCFVNAQVASDPRLPFGGVRDSGYGRELGAEGIQEFINIKTVVVA